MLEFASQYIPVDGVQSAVPHWQSTPAVFSVAPLMTAHVVGGRTEHVLEDASQYKPVDSEQSEVPHLQSTPAVFEVRPSVTAHVVDGRELHELELQYIPVVDVQLLPPQKHDGTLFD